MFWSLCLGFWQCARKKRQKKNERNVQTPIISSNGKARSVERAGRPSPEQTWLMALETKHLHNGHARKCNKSQRASCCKQKGTKSADPSVQQGERITEAAIHPSLCFHMARVTVRFFLKCFKCFFHRPWSTSMPAVFSTSWSWQRKQVLDEILWSATS